MGRRTRCDTYELLCDVEDMHVTVWYVPTCHKARGGCLNVLCAEVGLPNMRREGRGVPCTTSGAPAGFVVTKRNEGHVTHDLGA